MNKFQKFLSGFLSVKDSNVTRAIIINAHGDPKRSPRNFDTFAKEGYQWCVTVYSCIDLIANSCAGIKLKLVNSRGREILKHPKLDLLAKPNPEQHYAEYITSVVSYDCISGNVFELAIGSTLLENPGLKLPKPPIMLETMRPDRMEINPGAGGTKVSGYTYKIGADKTKYDPSRVLHRKRFHPTDDWWGLSPLEVGGATIDTDNASSKWNLFLLQNYGAPAGLIITKGNLSEEQRANLARDVQVKYSGPENAGRPLLVESDGGADWKPLSQTPKDMDWLNGRKITARDICKIFNVPSQLLGDPDSQTYANFEMAEEAFFKNNICPYMDKLVDGWNNWFEQWWDDGTHFIYDKADIEALQEDQDDLHNRLRADYSAGLITANEFREKVGMDPIDPKLDPLADVRLVPFSFQPVTDMANNSDNGESPNDPASVEAEKHKSFNVNTPLKKAQYFKSIDRQRRSHTFRAEGIFRKQFKSDYAECANIVRGSDNVMHSKNEIEKFLGKENKSDWHKALNSIYKGVIPDFGKRILASLGKMRKDDNSYDWNDAVSEYLNTYGGKKITQINETTRNKIMASIDESVAEGFGIVDMADAIDGIDSEYRAEMIARTEVIGASNYGSLEGAYATGLDCNKVWLSEIDDRTRGAGKNDEYDHISVDGESVALDDTFEGTGESMDFPGDPDGDSGDVINCRCTITYEINE